MSHLSKRYRITEINLDLRKRFMAFAEPEIRLLARLQPWAERIADSLAREFYEHQFSFSETRAFFEEHARKRSLPLSELRRHLERAQAGYFRQIFTEAAQHGRFGLAYFEKRLYVGQLHNTINLPLKWYLGSYTLYANLVRSHLRRHYWHRPRLRREAERAIFAVFNFDMQAITEAFLHDQFETIGFDFERIAIADPRHDLSDRHEQVKRVLSQALGQTLQTGRILGGTSEVLADAACQSRKAIRRITASADEVAETSTTLAQAVACTADSTLELDQSIQAVADHAESLAETVSVTASGMSEVAKTIQHVADDVSLATLAAEKSAEAAQAGREAVERTMRGMGRIDAAIGEVVEVITRLGRSSEQIGALLSVVDEIADQTHLLALNATIEAARAGEHGRGFAVVADEVRKLAERSAQATREIAALVGGIQQETAQAMRCTQEGEAAVQEGSELARSAEKSLSAIVSTVSQVSQRMEKISQATGEQRVAATEFLEAVTRMTGMTEEVAAASRAQARETAEIRRAVEDMARMTQEVSREAESQRADCAEVDRSSERLERTAGELREQTRILLEALAYFKEEKKEALEKGPAERRVLRIPATAGR